MCFWTTNAHCSQSATNNEIIAHFLSNHTTLNVTAEQCMESLTTCSEAIFDYGKALNQVCRTLTWKKWFTVVFYSSFFLWCCSCCCVFLCSFLYPAYGQWCINQSLAWLFPSLIPTTHQISIVREQYVNATPILHTLATMPVLASNLVRG